MFEQATEHGLVDIANAIQHHGFTVDCRELFLDHSGADSISDAGDDAKSPLRAPHITRGTLL